ncbi:MAG: VWA domain-containing protein [Promethearchaeota archaeon]|nr:MAG: VWA domain-containing protein [Candidatus Lokiarchaeota archaeon]
MGVFPENPCEFAIDFIRKMRKHPDIVQIPSSRQVLSIPKLILSRYYRNGNITPNDFIEISMVTSFPDNQEIAKDIAFEILFPNYKKDVIQSFFEGDSIEEGKSDKLEDEFESELSQLQELFEEIELSNSIDSEAIQELEDFIDDLNQRREEEPFKSALQFFDDDSELYKEKISSLEKLIEEATKRLSQKINSLDPEDINAAVNLGLEDLIQKNSIRDWEKLTSQALAGQDISDELNHLLQSGKLNDLLETMKFMNKSSDQESIKSQIKKIKDQLKNQIKTLDELFNATKTLGETPEFDLDELIENSLKHGSFDHNFNLANSLDQYFGTNLRSELLEKMLEKGNFQSNLSLENLTKNAVANKAWNSLLNQALQNAIKDAQKQNIKFEAFKNLTHQLQQLANSCANPHCSQKIGQALPDLLSKTLESCENPEQLKNATEFLRKLGMNLDSEEIKKMGEKLEMPEEEIYELIEPNYQLLNKMIQKKLGDFQKITNLMNQIKDQINHDRLKELMASALANENRDALGALGHFNLNDAIKAANQIGGTEAQDKMISSLSAGSGENLLKEWYVHRSQLPNDARTKIKELAKKMLVDLGIYYSRARLGSSTTGPMPINIVRPYNIGDDFENIDLEETIFNLLEKGKELEHLDYSDFYVFETAKGLRSACIELDISGSMSGDKLAYMAICVTMLVYGLRKDELAITFFESDTHVLKNMTEKIDLDKLADDLLTISARGGTRMLAALQWARDQFKENANSREKLNILFTDAEIYDIKEAMEELRKFRSMGIDFILICPEASFNINEAEKMVKIAGGQLLTINDWNEFPQLISDIIKSRF